MSARLLASVTTGGKTEGPDNISQADFRSLLRRVEELELAVAEMQRASGFSNNPLADPADLLRESCRDRNIPISVDGYIAERDVALLLNRSRHTIKNWRDQHRPMSFRKLGGRVEYSLDDLAAFLACQNQIETDWS